MRKFGSLIVPATLVSALLACATVVHAQVGYPNKPIRFITPYAPGGSTTVMARMIGQHLTERWGQNVIVDNRPGGNTIIGTETVARSAPDGYTLLLVTSTHSILSSLTKTPYDPVRDFAPIATIGISPQVLVLNMAVQANTVQEVIALAKARPGQLNFASSGAGGPTHLSGELFNLIAGVKTQHIPYKGAGPAMIDVVGGHVDMMFEGAAINYAKDGKVRALAVSSATRSPVAPQLPTMQEAGVPGYESTIWFGIVAPAATPAPIVNRLSHEITKALAQPAMRERLSTVNLIGTTPEAFAAHIRAEIPKWRKVIESAKISFD